MHTNEWIASVPSPSDWITLQLSCAAWHPPPRLANHALFCEPAVDRIATQAAQLQTTNPVAADRLWHAPTATSPTSRPGSQLSPKSRPTSSRRAWVTINTFPVSSRS
jgi:hypothetical protein